MSYRTRYQALSCSRVGPKGALEIINYMDYLKYIQSHNNQLCFRLLYLLKIVLCRLISFKKILEDLCSYLPRYWTIIRDPSETRKVR